MQKVTVVRSFRFTDPPKGVARRHYEIGEDFFVPAETASFLADQNPTLVKTESKPTKKAEKVSAAKPEAKLKAR